MFKIGNMPGFAESQDLMLHPLFAHICCQVWSSYQDADNDMQFFCVA